MNLLEQLLSAQNGGAVQQVSQQFGLDQNQATSAISALLPALANGLGKNASQQGGMEGLLGALTGGNHSRYLEQPELLGSPETVQDGNGILGHILGSKDASRSVARQAAQQTGLGEGMLKQMLPVVATMVMGAMSKQVAASPGTASPAAASGLLGMLTPFLDQNRDGSAVDDVLGMAAKLFK